MTKAILIFMRLVAYTCVATVIAALVGLAYLWQTNALSDERAFQLVALLHNIDLARLEEEAKRTERETPPEEPSLEDLDRARSLQMRNHELKSAQIERNLQEFEHLLNQIQEQQRRFDSQAKSFKDLLAAEEAKSIEQGNTEVAGQWEIMKPAQVKDLIMTMRENNEIRDVVMLLSRIDDNKKKKILAQFSTEIEEEKEAIYEIQALLRDGFPKRDVIEAVRRQGAAALPGTQE